MKKHKAYDELTEYSLSAQNSDGNNWEPFVPVVFSASNLFHCKKQARIVTCTVKDERKEMFVFLLRHSSS